MIIVHDITLDLKRRGPLPRVDVKQNDAFSRQIAVHLCCDGTAWSPPDGVVTVIRYQKPDGTAGLYDTLPDGIAAYTLSENTVTITPVPQMFTVPGIVQADIALILDHQILATFIFLIAVEPAAAPGTTLESTSYYRIASLEQINTAIDSLEAGIAALEAQIDDLAENITIATGVPDYVRKEANRVIKSALAVQNEHCLTMGILSDIHHKFNDASIHAALHAGQALAHIRKYMNLDCCACLGDVINGGPNDGKLLSENYYNYVNFCICEGFIGVPNFRCNGNHDTLPYNIDGVFSASEVYARIGIWNADAVKDPDNLSRNYGYYDFLYQKIRVIYLNTCDVGDIPVKSKMTDFPGCLITATQLTWLASVLDLSEKPDASSWGIVLLGHHPLDWPSSRYTDAEGKSWDMSTQGALTLLDAYAAGASGSVIVNGSTATFNFAGKNAARIICYLHGHTHNYVTGEMGGAKVKRLALPNVLPGRDNEYTSKDGMFEALAYPKTADSAEDTAFCIVTIDRKNHKIIATHYGAGYDRVVFYDTHNALEYTITYRLTNTTTDNSSTTVMEGGSYTANLIPVTGYSLTSVTVIQGGIDVTSAMYRNGTVTVPNATGNLVITATAEEISKSYVNQIPLSVDVDGSIFNEIGYKADVRINSSGSEVADTGHYLTGLIPFTTGDVIRLKGCQILEENGVTAPFALYDTNKGFISVVSYTNLLLAYSVETDDSGITTVDTSTIINEGNTWSSDAAYIRFMAPAMDDTSVLTINEEII